MNISILLPLFLCIIPASLLAQEGAGRHDHAERARPSFEREHEKRDLGPWLLSSTRSSEFGLFLNSNTIVEPPAQQFPQNESSIAIHPLDPKVLIASAVDGRTGAHVYLSTDGGNSWTNKSLGVVHPNWQSGNDPSVAWDYLGNGYLMYGAFPRAVGGGFTGESGVYIAKTTDKGVTWTSHIVVIEHVGAMTPDSAFEDKYYVEVDNSPSSPQRGNLYTPWKRVIDSDSSTQIVVTRSTDGGLTWSLPIRVSPRKPGTSTDTTFGQSFPLTTTGPDGTLYVVWNDGPIRSIGFAKSTDGGLTFSAPSYPVQGYPTHGTARKVGNDVYHVLKGTFRAETYPTLMADNSNSTRRGWLYLAWAAGLNPDVYFSRSTDGGGSWSTPKIIQSETRGDQWWPWLSVDETNGDIAVMYSDSRHDPENILIDQYVSYSSDGGATWIDRRVTDYQSDFRDNPFGERIFAGDYSGNAFHDGKIYPSFLDTRDDNDVYTAVVNTRKPYPVENLAVRTTLDDLQRAILTWRNPALMETVFGRPILNYTLLLSRDGVKLAELPAGTTSYADDGRQIDTTYDYTVRVVVGPDTSVARNVSFRASDARLPAGPVIIAADGFLPQVQIETRLPAVRADSVSPLENLRAIRIYRDGVLLREQSLASSDTGKTIAIVDAPAERGYYRYWLTVVDAADPVHESRASDTMTLYAGDLSAYTERFDGARPRFLYRGSWDRTEALAVSAPSSFTDSPVGDYKARQSNIMQIYPVEMPAAVDLQFAHICIVDPGDTAAVEVSYDSGATWSQVARFSTGSDPRWEDKKADAGDWRLETIRITPPSAGSVGIVRFRLGSGSFTHRDGWYIDDLSFGQISGVDQDGTERGSISVYPNPTTGTAIIEYWLSRRAYVTARIVDLMGRTLSVPVDGSQEEGRYGVTFDGSGLPAGIYFFEINIDGKTERGRIVLAK